MQSISTQKIRWPVLYQFVNEEKSEEYKRLYKLAVINQNYLFQKYFMEKHSSEFQNGGVINASEFLWGLITESLKKNRIICVFLIDANNIFYTKKHNISFKNFSRLYSKLVKEARKFPICFYFIFDGSIFKKIDEVDRFINYYLNHDRIIISNMNLEADAIILKFHEKISPILTVKVFSKDKFRDYDYITPPEDILTEDFLNENNRFPLTKFYLIS